MAGIPLSVIVEGSVAVLLALSIGYSVLLNHRLKRLHADRGELRQMIADLVRATDMANQAIGELKAAAAEADTTLGGRLNEAERFAIELANHINSGRGVLDRIAQITQAARKQETVLEAPAAGRATEALKALRAHQSEKGRAA